MDDDRPAPERARLPTLGVSRRRADAVADALRDSITDGTIGPGSRLREVALAKHFGVSATPVREALRCLEREGLIDVDPYRGATVTDLTAAELAHLYEIHELLECRAVRRVAKAVDRALPELEAILDEAETLLTEPDQTAFNRLDLAFHRALNRSGGNAPLAELIEQLHRRIQGVRLRHVGHLPGRPALSHAQHLEIVAAVRLGHADRAEILARSHIRSVRDIVVGILAEPSRQDVA